jgi:hypothetical protein
MVTVHVFWDNSNIFIPAKFAANRRDGAMLEHAVRIQFDNMYRLASAARNVDSAVCVGSVPPELEAVWDRLEAAGVDVELYERGAGSGTEQGLDQCLQVHMLRTLADSEEPAVAVLLTGDGAGYEDGAGFHADLERMARRGWGIEVLSWEAACNRRLKTWAQQAGVYIALDDYYESITFIEHGRRSKPLSLTRRPTAQPRKAPV